MLPIKNLFGFRKNKGLDKSIIQKNPYRNNTDLNKRQFIKKGLLGMAGLGGLALASKVAKAGGLVFNDGSTQAAGSLEGTSIKSTSETGGTKYLREDGDNSCSWQAPASVGKHTLWIPAAAMRSTDSNGCASITDVETTSGRPDLQVLDFDTSADEHAQFQIAMPKSWNESTITFRVFWTSTATDTDGVAWALQGVATANDDTVDVVYGTAVVVTDDNISAAEDCLITAESSAVTIAGSPSTDELCFFRIFRDVSDANDDMAEDARLIGIQMFVTTDAGEDT